MPVLSPNKICNETKLVAGQHTTVAASDAVTVPELTTIQSAVATLNSNPGDDPLLVSCSFSGNVLTIKTWKTDGSDPTPAAASTFSKLVSWMAVGI